MRTNNKLPFLDTCVKRIANRYTTTIYHKKTFTGVYLNWTSLTARKYKIGLIKCLLNRIYRICAEKKDREIEIRKLKHTLIKNDFPEKVIDCEVERYLKYLNRDVSEPTAEQEKPKREIKRFLVLPYVNTKCESYARRLKQLVEDNIPKVEFNVAYQTPRTIGSLFPYKDKITDKMSQSLVVYRLKCRMCQQCYIGKTERALGIRYKEHVSIPKVVKEETKITSAVKEHMIENPGHTFPIDSLDIVDRASNDHKLKVKELLHILEEKPTLNKQLNPQSKYDIKTIIVQVYPQFRT